MANNAVASLLAPETHRYDNQADTLGLKVKENKKLSQLQCSSIVERTIARDLEQSLNSRKVILHT